MQIAVSQALRAPHKKRLNERNVCTREKMRVRWQRRRLTWRARLQSTPSATPFRPNQSHAAPSEICGGGDGSRCQPQNQHYLRRTKARSLSSAHLMTASMILLPRKKILSPFTVIGSSRLPEKLFPSQYLYRHTRCVLFENLWSCVHIRGAYFLKTKLGGAVGGAGRTPCALG